MREVAEVKGKWSGGAGGTPGRPGSVAQRSRRARLLCAIEPTPVGRPAGAGLNGGGFEPQREDGGGRGGSCGSSDQHTLRARASRAQEIGSAPPCDDGLEPATNPVMMDSSRDPSQLHGHTALNLTDGVLSDGVMSE